MFGGGAVLAGMVLGAIAVLVIDREFNRAVIASLFGAVCAFFGLINAAGDVGFNVTPTVEIGYVFMAVVFLIASWRNGTLTGTHLRALATPVGEAV